MASAGKIDITPETGCWLDGNVRSKPSDSIHGRLFGRCTILDSGVEKIAVIAVDVCALKEKNIWNIRDGISKKTGLKGKSIIIACSHTHSGPATVGFFNMSEENYIKTLEKALIELAVGTSRKLEDASIGIGTGREETISEYRRLITKEGKIVMNWEGYNQEDIVGPAGEPDPEIGVIKIAGSDGRIIALIYNHAGHPCVLGSESFSISPDYPGYSSKIIEQELDCIALFTNGAEGSVDIPFFEGRGLEGIENKGKLLAKEVIRVSKGIKLNENPFVSLVSSRLSIPKYRLDPDLIKWAEEKTINSEDSVQKTACIAISDEIYARQVLWLNNRNEKHFEIEIEGVAIDDTLILTIPGELYTEIGLEIKERSSFGNTFIFGLTNGYQGYIPTEKAFLQGGYGSQPGEMARFYPRAERMIVEKCIKIAGELYSRRIT